MADEISAQRKTTLPAGPAFGAVEHSEMSKQVEQITSNAVMAIREVIKTAEGLEALVITNAARVRSELSEHVALTGMVKQEAARLGDVIAKLGEAQAEIAVERRNH